MQRSTKLSRQTGRWVAGIVVTGACIVSPIVGFAGPDSEQPSSAVGAADAAASGVQNTSAPGRAGQWIHIDPQTGRRIAPKTPSVAMPPVPAFSTSHQGLVEQAAPGGGVMVDLQGRFRSAASATVGSDGKVAVDCVLPGTATSEEPKP